ADGFPHWVDSARRKPRTPMHPLKHILVQLVLASCSKSSTTSVERCRPDLRGKSLQPELRAKARALAKLGLSVRAISTRLACDWKTADRLLKPIPQRPSVANTKKARADREAWLEHCRSNPGATRTELRRRAEALFMRLYRGDREWLLTHAPKCAARM